MNSLPLSESMPGSGKGRRSLISSRAANVHFPRGSREPAAGPRVHGEVTNQRGGTGELAEDRRKPAFPRAFDFFIQLF